MITAEELTEDLKRYGHYRTTVEGVENLLRQSKQQKEGLQELFEKNSAYKGDGRIILEVPFKREMDKEMIKQEVITFPEKSAARRYIVSDKNENGKTKKDLLDEAVASYPPIIRDISELERISVFSISEIQDQFLPDGTSVSSNVKYAELVSLSRQFEDHTDTVVGDTLSESLNQNSHGKLKISPTMKTSRAFNRLYSSYGVNGAEYNAAFPHYADLINAKEQKQKFVISVNIVDFLRMSFGNTWSSCHTIDPENVRGIKMKSNSSNYHGMRRAGSLSYGLDDVSFIAYTVNADTPDEEVADVGKIYRCVFQYMDGYLIQGRMYPQDKDGSLDLYKKFRHVVQQQLCEMLDIPWINNGDSRDPWKKMGNTKGNNNTLDVAWEHIGLHYHDIDHFDGCNISKLKAIADGPIHINIGHEATCLCCGRRNITDGGSLFCSHCN